jgi:hypothetical protein
MSQIWIASNTDLAKQKDNSTQSAMLDEIAYTFLIFCLGATFAMLAFRCIA